MKLKPMDENTLAFLQALVSQHEITLGVIDDKTSAHINGWHAAEVNIIVIAADYFVDSDRRFKNVNEFMEAIKAYELTNTN